MSAVAYAMAVLAWCRFTQGSFVRMVEELGIGRPSTYSSIIEVLKQRGYVHQTMTWSCARWTTSFQTVIQTCPCLLVPQAH